MHASTLSVDAYQLTTLVTHADAGRLAQQARMAFFFRRLPRSRNFVVFCGLARVLEHAAAMKLTGGDMTRLREHPTIGPALAKRPELVRALEGLDGFAGEIDAVPEGTLAFAGPARTEDGAPFTVGGAPLAVYTPVIQIRTDMMRAKLVETPWLGFVNHMSMVASKAARVVLAAGGKTVMEFGQRRTHPVAALDATYAAYLAGATATSNMAAFAAWGIPAYGTMDHFAIQAAEEEGVPRQATEERFFRDYRATFGGSVTFLVDTYDTERGIRSAVRAAEGGPFSIRIDSNVTRDTITRARALLAELGASHGQIFVSDGLDEHKVKDLADLVDGFGVGENISCSPDAAAGIGAVAKLVVNGYGKITMKLSKGSGKATLPGRLQVHRAPDHDLLALHEEAGPAGTKPLLEPVWRDRAPVKDLPTLAASRAYVARQLAELPPALRALEIAPEPRPLVLSRRLAELVVTLGKEAGA